MDRYARARIVRRSANGRGIVTMTFERTRVLDESDINGRAATQWSECTHAHSGAAQRGTAS